MDRPQILQTLQSAMLAHVRHHWPLLLGNVAADLLDQADRAQSAQAARSLLDARAAWLAADSELHAAWLAHLERLLKRSLQTAFHRERQRFSQHTGQALSLRDLAEVEQELALERQIAAFRSQAGSSLQDLNARIANLYHQTETRERENPFRPYVICGSLALAIGELNLLSDIAEVLQKAAAKCLSQLVVSLYQTLNQLLDEAAIPVELPLQIRRQAEPTTPPPPAHPPAGLAEQAPRLPRSDLLMRWIQMKTSPETARQAAEASPPPHWLDPQVNAGQLLRELFGSRPAGAQHQPAGFTTFAGSTVLASSISELEREALAAQAENGSEALLRNRILENRARLSSQARDPSERMVVDVVAMLFEFMLRDGKVPQGVRGQLGRMQFQLLKLGLFDPTLFAESSHPARQLVNRIGSVAVELEADDPLCAELNDEIGRLVDRAVQAPHSDAELFASLLGELERYLANAMANSHPDMAKAVAALASAEDRTSQYLQAVAAARTALVGLDMPQRLHDFLSGTWPLVLERVGREDPAQAGLCRRLVPRLVWSVLPKTSNGERMQMLKVLPELVHTLSEQLAHARLDDIEQQTFLNWLVEAHLEAIKEGHPESGPALSEVEAHLATYVQGDPAADSLPAAGEDFHALYVSEALGELDDPLELLDARFDGVQLAQAAAQATAPLSEEMRSQVISQLRAGVVVDIAFGGSSRRARLNWISPRAACLLLTIAGLGKPAALSVQLFRRLLALGHVRFIESEPLFERAVMSLLRNADEMEYWSSQESVPAA